MELLFMEPVFKEAIWGARSFATCSAMRFREIRQVNAGP